MCFWAVWKTDIIWMFEARWKLIFLKSIPASRESLPLVETAVVDNLNCLLYYLGSYESRIQPSCNFLCEVDFESENFSQ